MKSMKRLLASKRCCLIIEGVIVSVWAWIGYITYKWAISGDGAEPWVVLGTQVLGLCIYIRRLQKLWKTEEELQEAKFSISKALALGYVHNFVEPAVRALRNETLRKKGKVKLLIYIPDKLTDLEEPAQERLIQSLREKKFKDESVRVDLDKSRPRSVLTIKKSGSSSLIYFDFPNTLLSLKLYVDFKVESKADVSSEVEKEALGRRYISSFKDYVAELLVECEITEFVSFTDKNLTELG